MKKIRIFFIRGIRRQKKQEMKKTNKQITSNIKCNGKCKNPYPNMINSTT